MCGISGFLDLKRQLNAEQLQHITRCMSDSLRHRGPDSDGVWVDENVGIGLGHRRLAIVDLSPTGYQPMHSSNGRYVITFNGEVYNFQALRSELEKHGCQFIGTSDTEVMLAAFETWGIERSIEQFVGMFAFALWDRQDQTLHLIRDRLGIKPLYYGWFNDTFVFGSELKALRVHPNFQCDINHDALTLFLRYNYIPAPHSIYDKIYKLPPASWLTIRPDSLDAKPQAYWSLQAIAETQNRIDSQSEALDKLKAILSDAVKIRMIADVPLGAFLSGGVDSSTVVALMQTQSHHPVKTFTIGFEEEAYNESHHAAAVAKQLGTDHTELIVTQQETLDVILRLPTLYDEPFADSSQIPTFLVSQLARRHVTVSLSGDGGDELFAGYNRHFWGHDLWPKLKSVPRSIRQVAGFGISYVAPHTWDALFKRVAPMLPKRFHQRNAGFKLHKLAEVLSVTSADEMYRRLVAIWKNSQQVVINGKSVESYHATTLEDFTLRMMYFDSVTYLPDDILTKLDRATMGVSLEGRVPLLDHRVVELAWRIPLEMKIRHGQGKWILRQLLYQYVPKALIERPKTGFGIPLDRWLRDELREWAEALLTPQRLKADGFFDPKPIRQKWEQHQSGKYDWAYALWSILMFQAWKG